MNPSSAVSFTSILVNESLKESRQTSLQSSFLQHFQNLSVHQNQNEAQSDDDFDLIQSSVYEELDNEISFEEIVRAIKNLNANKCCAEDLIINEIFIKCSDVLVPSLYKLFNFCATVWYFSCCLGQRLYYSCF